MLCNDVEKLSNFACNLGILRKRILLMPYGNDVKMYKIMTYQQAKRYEAGSKKAQNEMNCHLPGVCNEFYTDGWHVAVGISNSGLTPLTPEPPSSPFPNARLPPPPKAGTDVVDLEDAEVTSILVVKEPFGAGLPQDDPAPTAEGGSTAPLDPDFANL
jgi:hypothetical protein